MPQPLAKSTSILSHLRSKNSTLRGPSTPKHSQRFGPLYAYSIVLVSERDHDALSTDWINDKRRPGPNLVVIPSAEGQLRGEIEEKVAAAITDTFPTESFGSQDSQLNALTDHFFFKGNQLDAFALFSFLPGQPKRISEPDFGVSQCAYIPIDTKLVSATEAF